MGRRFPSIRLKSKDKKDAKKILAFSASDKAVEVNGAKGSCVRAASAIYGDEPSKLDDFESNIYENGHIVMKNDDKGWYIKRAQAQKFSINKKSTISIQFGL